MGLSGGENQEVLVREARMANSAASAAPCMCVRVLEWSSGRLAGQANRHGKNLKGNDLHYSARKKIGAK